MSSSAQSNIRYTDDGFPVRIAYFWFEHQYLPYEKIETYFKSVGEVVGLELSFRLCPKPIQAFGFVQYQRPEHAAELIKRSNCYIDGMCVRVKEANSCYQPKVPYAPAYSTTQSTDDDAQTARNESNGIPVPDLNDDCLRKIVGYLNVLDLFSVAEACTRFQLIAQEQFSIKHKVFSLREFDEAAKEVEQKVTTQVLESFLQHFGPIITDLTVPPTIYRYFITDDEIFDLIMDHCGETINVLRLFHVSIKGLCVQKFRPLFARLQKLYLTYCELDCEFIRMLEGCQRLTHLSFHPTVFDDCNYSPLQFHLPVLEMIQFKNGHGFSKQQVKNFLERNPQLKEVNIFRWAGINVDILPEIVRHVPLVEKIVFMGWDNNYNTMTETFTRNAMHLKQLRSLKHLRLDCSGNSPSSIFSEMASAKVPLEILHVSGCEASRELISSICKFETLHTVSLYRINDMKASHLHEMCEGLTGLSKLTLDYCPDFFDTADLIKLVRSATKLQELIFYKAKHCQIQIDEDTFETLVGIIKMRPDSLPLKIILNLNCEMYNKITNLSDELVTANRDILIIIDDSHKYCKHEQPQT